METLGSKSDSKRLSQSVSCKQCDAARYSASHVLKAIDFCFLDDQLIGAPKLMCIAPSWLKREVELAKSESENADSGEVDWLG